MSHVTHQWSISDIETLPEPGGRGGGGTEEEEIDNLENIQNLYFCQIFIKQTFLNHVHSKEYN